MRLKDNLIQQGQFLFRWRSFVPLVLLPALLPALTQSRGIEAAIGDWWDDLWMLACLGLSFTGLAVRGLTVGFVPGGTSGRNTRTQRAEALNTTGMYSVVRNPLYLGNFIAIIGLALATKVWWFVLLTGFAYTIYIERIILAEEEYLAAKFGNTYASWAMRTPAFWPRLGNWQAPDLAFSLRTVLRREYSGFFAVILAFLTIELMLDLGLEGQHVADWLDDDWPWPVIFVVGLAAYLTLRTLKKFTRVLDVAGR